MGQFTDKYDRFTVGGPIRFTATRSSAANQFFGRTNIVSDTIGLTAVVSTALVNSDSIIMLTPQLFQTQSLTGFSFAVSTISPGGFFKVTTTGSLASAATSGYVHWVLFNAVR